MRHVIDRVMKWGIALGGVFMMGFSVYMVITPSVNPDTTRLFIACAFAAGAMLMFENTDRNVYKDRLENLYQLIGDTDYEVERYEYTNYRFTNPEGNNVETEQSTE